MLKNTSLMTVQRRSMHWSRALFMEKASSPSFNTKSVADQLSLSPSVLTQALTHKSFKHGKVPSNERLQYVGHRSLEFFALEANMNKQGVEELKNAIVKVFEPAHLAAKFDALGLEAGVQCHLPQDVVTLSVKSKTLEAIVGAIYHERGLNAAKEFVKKHVLV
ncbi:ribonuclease-III-like-domain-containing protein [Mucor mucedo]|uniref:ribonuclease-III-like-domain-containing protein n=1 Tax=Mucor mucedo TaxID=29922 RepID=UPI0022208664|nr:ribonuclease-III-like-domain-containing protein [Mucor mucedo]KAI7894701.1 ribonuclease-III-like-domain-containing protein [Mucor mucedo]